MKHSAFCTSHIFAHLRHQKFDTSLFKNAGLLGGSSCHQPWDCEGTAAFSSGWLKHLHIIQFHSESLAWRAFGSLCHRLRGNKEVALTALSLNGLMLCWSQRFRTSLLHGGLWLVCRWKNLNLLVNQALFASRSTRRPGAGEGFFDVVWLLLTRSPFWNISALSWTSTEILTEWYIMIYLRNYSWGPHTLGLCRRRLQSDKILMQWERFIHAFALSSVFFSDHFCSYCCAMVNSSHPETLPGQVANVDNVARSREGFAQHPDWRLGKEGSIGASQDCMDCISNATYSGCIVGVCGCTLRFSEMSKILM